MHMMSILLLARADERLGFERTTGRDLLLAQVRFVCQVYAVGDESATLHMDI